MGLTVYIGWDKREERAAEVARNSLLARTSMMIDVNYLKAQDLYDRRLLWRPVERSGEQLWDHLSNAPMSTEFANSRFTIPFICRDDWALFVDCDTLFNADVAELYEFADDRFAVMCVKHQYVPTEKEKMSGMLQTSYPRKNWSSVVLWNLLHPAHQRLNLSMVNHYPGELLHRFFWLRDSEIGMLPAEWNWLVNVQPKPEQPKIAHFTLGGPWLPDWKGAEHDDMWLLEESRHG